MKLDPFSREFHADPYPTYAWLREYEPCHRSDDGWYALSRYDDVLAASQQPLLYSSAEGTSIEALDTATMPPMMIFMDPPDHDILRKLVIRVFTPRAVADLESFVRATASELLARLRANGGGDFVEEFSSQLPMNVIMQLLGVPPADRDPLRRWMDASLERGEKPPYVTERALDGMTRMHEYWAAFVADRRARPDGGFVSDLCQVEIDDGSGRVGLTDAEVIGFCNLIGAAGTETLTKLLANAVVLFQRNPSEWLKVRSDPSSIPGAVEETLRYWPPSQYQGRVLTDDVTMHDVHIPTGARVLLLTGSANHDEREFTDPDRFDIDREPHLALGFGVGLHFCLGAALARLEGRVGLEEFVRAFPDYEIDEDNLRRVEMSNVHGFASVPITPA
jgi:cytochrome P450